MQVSFVWAETTAASFVRHRPAPAIQISSEHDYRSEYDQVHEGDGLGPLTLPWTSGNRFWTFYLGGLTPGNAPSVVAWDHLVPLRSVIDPRLEDVKGAFRLLGEILLFPFGFSLVMTAALARPMELAAAIDAAVQLRREAKRLRQQGVEGSRASLDVTAGRLMSTARESLLGLQTEETRSVDPLIVATLVRTNTGATPPATIRSALHGLATMDDAWRDGATGGAEADLGLSTTRRRPTHVLYALARGRAVYFPTRSESSGKSHAMSCYHRNLVLATNQTESLAMFTAATQRRLETGVAKTALPLYHRKTAERAVDLLGAMWRGDDTTYRSSSVRAQIASRWMAPLNAARETFGLPELQDPAAQGQDLR
ncbi:MAG TPA: hypothetical protein VES62_07860 [Thermoleophilaceae bacterium]|nr:hypothetical protein [Thermoleophilaceae bacterium]